MAFDSYMGQYDGLQWQFTLRIVCILAVSSKRIVLYFYYTWLLVSSKKKNPWVACHRILDHGPPKSTRSLERQFTTPEVGVANNKASRAFWLDLSKLFVKYLLTNVSIYKLLLL